MKSLKNLKNLKGKTAIVRVDFNVPIKNGKVVDDFRIKAALPTIKFLKSKGAKIILISHLGEDGKQSLKPVAEYLKKIIKSGVVLFENIRREKGEIKNDSSLAKKLAGLGDIYVNEAFSVSHRKHASIVGVPKYLPSYAGLQFEAEIKNLKSALSKPKRPFLFILGGAKFETKIPLINKFMKIADNVFVGGALANNFFKERGWQIGKSLADKKNFSLNKILSDKKLILPIDVVARSDSKNIIKKPYEVFRNEFIADVGPESVKLLERYIKESKLVLWNGPMGNYEKGYGKATEDILKILAKSKAKIIIGGGDTIALISKLKLEKKFAFISTGGGATLEFLAKGTLPGIEALR